MTELRNLLSEIVAIGSIYPNEKKLSNFLYQYLQNNGFNVSQQRVARDRYNLFAEKGEGEKAILFYGHLDTVNTLSLGWDSNPFELTEKNGNLYGIGTYDMKAGITAFLQAASFAKRKIKLFLAVDEENISIGAWKAVRENRSFFENVELIISAEPNFKNQLNNLAVGRTGRCVFEIDFTGLPVHASQFRKGVDAIELLGLFLNNFYSQRDSVFNSKYSFGLVRKVEAEAQGMSVCGQAKAEMEVFLGPEDNTNQILKKVQSLTTGRVTIKPRETPYLDGYLFKMFPFQKQIAEIIKKRTGKKIQSHLRSSVGDDNVLATLGIPVISWGPSGGHAHTANEYVTQKDLETLFLMYKDLVELLAS